jgi:hypothetical protein
MRTSLIFLFSKFSYRKVIKFWVLIFPKKGFWEKLRIPHGTISCRTAAVSGQNSALHQTLCLPQPFCSPSVKASTLNLRRHITLYEHLASTIPQLELSGVYHLARIFRSRAGSVERCVWLLTWLPISPKFIHPSPCITGASSAGMSVGFEYLSRDGVMG